MQARYIVRPAVEHDVDRLVGLQQDLFTEDAGVHGSNVDLSWPDREGRSDFEALLRSPRADVLAAETSAEPQHASEVVGFLAGYLSDPSPTRLAVDIATLRSLYVAHAHRGLGVGSDLCSLFVGWASNLGCVGAEVSAYVANEGAHRFYQRLGFEPRSATRVLPLPRSDRSACHDSV